MRQAFWVLQRGHKKLVSLRQVAIVGAYPIKLKRVKLMRIVILGGLGNYGLTLAGLATQRGHDVFLLQFPGTVTRIPGMPQKNYEPLIREFETNGRKYWISNNLQNNEITYISQHIVLRSVQEIPDDIRVMVIAYPSLLHESIGSMLKGRLNDKVVITFTDRFLGGFSILKNAEALGIAKLVAVSATPVTAFQDIRNHFKRLVFSDKHKIGIGYYPISNRIELENILCDIVPGDYKAYSSLLEVAFNCTPSNLHAPHDLLNVVRYEQAHEFTMFHEGFTQGVERLINAISEERCTVAKAFSLDAVSFLEYERQTYGYRGDSLTENRRLNPQLNQVPAPTSLYSCKGIEDVACALVPLSELAQLVSVQTPVINSIIDLWSCYLGQNLRKFGRSLESLGLSSKSPEEICRVVM